MTDGVEWEICQLLKDRIQQCTVANGYSVTMNKVRIQPDGLFGEADLPATGLVPDVNSLSSTHAGTEVRSLPVEITAYHSPLEDGGGERDVQKASQLKSDIGTVLYRKTTAPQVSDPRDHTLDGKVEGIQIQAMESNFGDDSSAYIAVAIDIVVTFRVKIGDHTKLA